jgi:hypothetical protein
MTHHTLCGNRGLVGAEPAWRHARADLARPVAAVGDRAGAIVTLLLLPISLLSRLQQSYGLLGPVRVVTCASCSADASTAEPAAWFRSRTAGPAAGWGRTSMRPGLIYARA